jgi:hypothetical protein
MQSYQTCVPCRDSTSQRVVLLCTARSQMVYLTVCHSSITRPSSNNKRQRSPHETMRPLGAVDLDADL